MPNRNNFGRNRRTRSQGGGTAPHPPQKACSDWHHSDTYWTYPPDGYTNGWLCVCVRYHEPHSSYVPWQHGHIDMNYPYCNIGPHGRLFCEGWGYVDGENTIGDYGEWEGEIPCQSYCENITAACFGGQFPDNLPFSDDVSRPRIRSNIRSRRARNVNPKLQELTRWINHQDPDKFASIFDCVNCGQSAGNALNGSGEVDWGACHNCGSHLSSL